MSLGGRWCYRGWWVRPALSTAPSQPLAVLVQQRDRSVLSSAVVSAGGVLTGKNLEGSGEEEASSFLQGEELAEEQEEGQAAEDDGEDHESLDRLDPLWEGGGTAVNN